MSGIRGELRPRDAKAAGRATLQQRLGKKIKPQMGLAVRKAVIGYPRLAIAIETR